jgi:hypothetical protein
MLTYNSTSETKILYNHLKYLSEELQKFEISTEIVSVSF